MSIVLLQCRTKYIVLGVNAPMCRCTNALVLFVEPDCLNLDTKMTAYENDLSILTAILLWRMHTTDKSIWQHITILLGWLACSAPRVGKQLLFCTDLFLYFAARWRCSSRRSVNDPMRSYWRLWLTDRVLRIYTWRHWRARVSTIEMNKNTGMKSNQRDLRWDWRSSWVKSSQKS